MSHVRRVVVCLFVGVLAASFSGLSAATVTEIIPASAPHGARAIVIGSGLDAGSIAVSFAAAEGGTASAAVISQSSSAIEVVVPLNAVSGDVQVSSGAVGVGTLSFALLPDPHYVKVTTLAASDKAHDVLKQPSGVAVSSLGVIYVADTMHHQIVSIQPNGQAAVIAGTGKPGLTDGASAGAQFKEPGAVAFDATRQFLYVADTANNVIRRLASDGTVSTFAGSGRGESRDGSGTQASFKSPAGLTVDASGNVYVADSGNDQIRMITPAGLVTTVAGGTHSGFADGAAAQALFKSPSGVAVTASGGIIIADSGNNRIRQLVAGVVTTIAGTGHDGFVNGAGGVAELKNPSAVSVDDAGNIYVADTGNNAIREIVGGIVSTLTGSSKAGYVDGAPATALFNEPSGLAFAGSLVIADAKNDAVRQIMQQLSATDLYPRSGDPAGGTVVRIFGSGFVPGATQVTFGGNAATAVTFVSSTELLATTPPGVIGNVDVTVTTAAGSATLAGRYRYEPPFVSLTIAPAGITLDPAQEQQFTALGVASNNATTDVTANVAWSSSMPSIVSISAGGLAHATSPGSTTITATLGNLLSTTTLTVRNPEPLPPDPASIAPPIAHASITLFGSAYSFLYTGADPIQSGVSPNAIDALRASVIRGRVINRDALPRPGVTVSISGHPEFGTTLTRADGRYDLVVNGGGALIIRFERNGFLTADRTVTPAWRDFMVVDDVALLAIDSEANALVANGSTVQVARGSLSTDRDGSRRATLIMPSGTGATMTLGDGSVQALTTLTIRATEYSVGATGTSAMPAELPPQSAYTYCVELSADEARSAGADSVSFSKPLAFYVENFLHLPTGTIIPAGFYDRRKGAWVGIDNGVVLKVLAVTNGVASLDTNGDGIADSAATLAAIGIDNDELQQIGGLYLSGQSLWRVRVSHFSPLDCNLPSGPPPPGATRPQQRPEPHRDTQDSARCPGSIIDCQNQVLGELLNLAGTGHTLTYNSALQRGRREEYRIDIPVTGPTVPSSMSAVTVRVSIGGQHTEMHFATAPNEHYLFEWNGQDAYGRTIQGEMNATIEVGYTYAPIAYATPTPALEISRAWAELSAGGSLVASRTGETTLWSEFIVPLGVFDAQSLGLGGWMLSAHHVYDPFRKVLHLGDGTSRTADALGNVVQTVAGNGTCCDTVGPTDATSASLDFPSSISPAPDGSFHIAANDRVYQVSRDGVITVAAGTGAAGYSGDGSQATAAQINAWTGAAGSDGTYYFAQTNTQIREISSDGMIRTIAGGTPASPMLSQAPRSRPVLLLTP